jgi:hypothetical protein
MNLVFEARRQFQCTTVSSRDKAEKEYMPSPGGASLPGNVPFQKPFDAQVFPADNKVSMFPPLLYVCS